MKTASRLLGTAFFLEGFQVQDAPRYGAERRGAPIFAYVRASREVIRERGIITNPNLVLVADETLVPVPMAAVLQGVDDRTLLLIHSREQPGVWQDRLNLTGPVLTLAAPDEAGEQLMWRYIGTACAAAAARLVGTISWQALAKALEQELGGLSVAKLADNRNLARWAYDLMAGEQGRVASEREHPAIELPGPDWISVPFEEARVATPAIHAKTSELVQTGLWRTVRPVIDGSRCRGCWWLCSTYCPDGAIWVDAQGRPQIDYKHCKGCLVCVTQCPNHAVDMYPERDLAAPDRREEDG